LSKKTKIEQEYDNLEKDIHTKADAEVRNIEEKVEKIKKEAEKIGQEVESSLTEKKH
jgi:hypothetical protein